MHVSGIFQKISHPWYIIYLAYMFTMCYKYFNNIKHVLNKSIHVRICTIFVHVSKKINFKILNIQYFHIIEAFNIQKRN